MEKSHDRSTILLVNHGNSLQLGGGLEAGLDHRKVDVISSKPLYDHYDQFDTELSQMGRHKFWIIVR